MKFKDEYIGFLTEAVGQECAATTLDALSEQASVSVRLNRAKLAPAHEEGPDSIFGVRTTPVAWCAEGFFLEQRPKFTLDPLLHAGCYYVQDSSAMFVGNVFRQAVEAVAGTKAKERPLRVLDLCAAPGGKTTDILGSLRASGCESYIVVSNEIMKQRAAVLAYNAGIWGDPCVAVTSADPKAFSSLEGYFDIIVADVPCSGEGMFRKDEEAVMQWSADNVALCQSRQRRIIADVWPALAAGGILIYSTCTFNKYENDDNVKWIISALGADKFDFASNYEGLFATGTGVSLLPGLVQGEGQYCSAVIKTGSDPAGKFKAKAQCNSKLPVSEAELQRNFRCKMSFEVRGDMIIATPTHLREEFQAIDFLKPILRGCTTGKLKGRDFIPDEDLALCIEYNRGAFPEFDLNREQALAFLHKDTLTLPEAEKGLVLMTYLGHPLGFVKNLGNRCNNLHPQGRRIRMNI